MSTDGNSDYRPSYVRLSININQEAAAFYRTLRASTGVSVTEAVRRATAVYKAVLEHIDSGGTVILRDDEGEDRLLDVDGAGR